MRALPLFPQGLPPSAVMQVEPRDREALPLVGVHGRDCHDCYKPDEHGAPKTPCMPAMGEGGGLLVIGEAPTKEQDRIGLPFSASSAGQLRQQLAEHWKGPVAMTHAVRCALPDGIADKYVNRCRGHLRSVLDVVQPTRILALGPYAWSALFDRGIQPNLDRCAYSWLQLGERLVPAIALMSPARAARNSFERRWLQEDIRWATSAPVRAWNMVRSTLREAGLVEPPLHVVAQVVETPEDAEQAAAALERAPWVCVDVETCGAMWSPGFTVISVALATPDGEVWVWPLEALEPLAPELQPLRRLLQGSTPKIGQNVKYDQLAFVSAYGWAWRNVPRDTRLQRKLTAPLASGALGPMSELVGLGGYKQEAAEIMAGQLKAVRAALAPPPPPLKSGKPSKRKQPVLTDLVEPALAAVLLMGADPTQYQYRLMPHDELQRYNARDALVTARLDTTIGTEVATDTQLQRHWDAVVAPAAQALVQVEAWGVPCSAPAVRAFDAYLEVQERAALQVLDKYGSGVNWDSTPQVAKLLFEDLRLPVGMRSKKTRKPSTSSKALEHLKGKHPLPSALLGYRHVRHMRSTYAQGMLPHITELGRIHPNVKVDGAGTGRLSCSDPNLQNIPRAKGSEEGKMARDCFVAPPGYLLAELDYSQLELRIAAMLSGDAAMIDVFRSGVDYHLRTAQMVSKLAWGIDPGDVTDEHRTKAKAVNFGVLYGKTAAGLAAEWGVEVAVVDRIMNAIMGRFKVLAQWIERQLDQCRRVGYVETQWNGLPARRRPLVAVGEQGDEDGADWKRNNAENSTTNTPVQGTAADYCTASLTLGVEYIVEEGIEDRAQLVLPVHDALLYVVREDTLDEIVHMSQRVMLSHYSAGVPLEVDCKVGRTWGTMKSHAL